MKHRKILSIITSIMMLITLITPIASAEPIQSANGVSLSNDSSTYDSWQTVFPEDSTENAGGVWTDKSVVSGTETLRGETADAGEFLIGLSAIGSSLRLKTDTGTPTDTVFVLDASNSMSSYRTTLSDAVNTAIDKLMTLNENNRVAVVFYHGSSNILLPLAHYTADDGKYITYGNSSYSSTSSLRNESGSFSNAVSTNRGTNQQAGMLAGLKIFRDSDSESKAGNIPVMVVMTDGETSRANSDYINQDGTSYSSQDARTTFLTQLTASYVKNTMATVYTGKAFHMYTMGFYPSGAGNTQQLARLLMNPDVYKENPNSNDAITTTLGYWEIYNNATGTTVSLGSGNNAFTVAKTEGLNMNYVEPDGAFESTSVVDLTKKFDEIYQKIESVSDLEYVTHVTTAGGDLSGYISFVDHIGEHMQVDDIRGLVIDGELYTGEYMASQFFNPTGVFGTIEEPTELGDELVRSIRTRLNLEKDCTLEEANAATHALIQNAYDSEQLSYSNIGHYSNYFGWYSDENFECIGAWNDKTDPDGTNYDASAYTGLKYPGNTGNPKYVNKSYLILGSDNDVYDMYITVRVCRDIETGEELVAFAVPAVKIPTIRYSVGVTEGETGDADPTITMSYTAATPITMLCEVKPGIDSNTLSLTDGTNNLYTNEWRDYEPDVSAPIEPNDVLPNAYSYFQPNAHNRKYYFVEEKQVYVNNGGNIELYEYDGDAPQDGLEYYYAMDVYTTDGTTVTKSTKYQKLVYTTIAEAVPNGDGTWKIPVGTPHHRMRDYMVPKENNITGTLDYSNIPFIEETESGLYACAILGNNGVAVVEDSTNSGVIKLSKTFADGITDSNATFEFTIEASGVTQGGLYTLKNNGTVAEKIQDLLFDSGKATVTLKADESVYIGGLPIEGTVTITEKDHVQYNTANVYIDNEPSTAVPVNPVNITVLTADYTDVVFENDIKPLAVYANINYLEDTEKETIDEIEYVDATTYREAIDQYKLKNPYINDSFTGNLAEQIPQYIEKDGNRYTKTGYTIVKNDDDCIVINEFYALDNWDDHDNNVTDGDDIPDKYQVAVYFHARENGSIMDGSVTPQIFTLYDENDEYAQSGKIRPVPNAVTAVADEGYVFDFWSEGESYDPVDPGLERIANAGDEIIFWANFTPDIVSEEDPHTEEGDEIADKYQARVKFISEDVNKGTVTGHGTNQVFTFFDEDGNYVDSGIITPTLDGVIITPTSGYEFSHWTFEINGAVNEDPSDPLIGFEGNSEDEYVFVAHFKTVGGGGGGGTSYGTLEISKTVDAPEDLDVEDMSFTFSVYKGSTDNGTKYKTVTVKANASESIRVPVGTYYVAEDNAEITGYTLETTCSSDNNTVKVTTATAGEISFENTYTAEEDRIPDDGGSMLNKKDHFAYIIGYPEDDVRPEANITRAEVATIFFRLLTDEAREQYSVKTNPYPDVNEGDWYNNAISTLTNAGIIDGYLDGTFRPNNPITRAELSKMAASFYNTQTDKTSTFSDIANHWAEQFIEAAYWYGFIDGYPDGTFKPNQYITRAETMKIVNRTLERYPDKDRLLDDMIKWPDNADTDVWYYADVQEATNSHDYTKTQNSEEWTKILPVRDWEAFEK